MVNKTKHAVDFSQRLFIELGTSLLIETGKLSLSSKLIGMKVGAYLIVDISGTEADVMALPKKEKVQVRYVNQSVFHFSSHIIMVLDQPDDLGFLQYPDNVESFNIRRHKRVACFMQIQVKSEGRLDVAVITNISATGCLCSMSHFPSWQQIVDQRIEILFPYGDHELLKIPGVVKSTHVQGTQIKLGVEFTEMDDYCQSILATLVPAIRF
jgi:hypothetical protein